MIVGSNGAGKSTILDALCFSLYGKAFRKINKGQMINTTNEKGAVVEIEFNVNKVDWKIERGIKPNTFKIWRNGEELDQKAAALDQQKWLEQNVLKMNYKSFTQIVILGSSSFVPFMQLPSSSRREVVEDLLDIKIFSSMNTLIKDKIRGIKEEVRTLELKKESLNDKVRMQKDFIEQLETKGKEDISYKEHKISSLLTEENECMNRNQKLNEELKETQREIEQFSNCTQKLREFGNIKGKLSNKISTLVKEHKFFNDNSVCPTCNQDIEESFRVNRITDSQNKAKDLQEGYQQLLNEIKKEEDRESHFKTLNGYLSTTLNEITSNNSQITGCQRQVKNIESEIQTLTKQLEDRILNMRNWNRSEKHYKLLMKS